MTRIYNQKKHEQNVANHPQHLPNGFYDERRFDFLNPDLALNDEGEP